MAKRLTEEDKLRINEVYYLTHNYAETARQTGFSAASVKKYVLLDFKPQTNIEKTTFNEDEIPKQIDYKPFVNSENWGEFCELTEEEKEEMKDLWKELVL